MLLRSLTFPIINIPNMQQPHNLLDLSAYNMPQSNTLGVRVQENFAAYGLQYGQLVLVCVLIGGFQNLTVLLTLLVSYVAWAFILKRQDVLDQLPNIGFIDSQDKKKIILLLFNTLLVLFIAGWRILSFVGIGCLLVMLHATLWKTASTQPGLQTEQEFEKVLVQSEYQVS